MRTICPDRPEPVGKAGVVLLSHNHISALHGLYDRPNGGAVSTVDLLSSTMVHARCFRFDPNEWVVRKSFRTLHPAWVTKRRFGRCMTWKITERGRAILELRVPAKIRGYGPYVGLRKWQQRMALHRSPAVVDARWKQALAKPELVPLSTAADALIRAWPRAAPAIGMGENLRRRYERGLLSTYVRRYVLLNEMLPTGVHRVSDVLTVDFEVLHDTQV
jgi:hypothetical protein